MKDSKLKLFSKIKEKVKNTGERRAPGKKLNKTAKRIIIGVIILSIMGSIVLANVLGKK